MQPLLEARLCGATDPVTRLPMRQQQALSLLLQGFSESEIARRMNISHGTLHKYVTDLYRRMEVSSRPQLHARFQNRGHLPDQLPRDALDEAPRLRRGQRLGPEPQ